MQISIRSPEPFFYLGNKTGILLIHGFTGSPAELRPLGNFLRNQDYTVYAPLLAGHGTSPEELKKTTWQDWWQSVLDGYKRLQSQEMEQIFVIGHSMGGLLAFHLSTQRSVTGVISLCTPIWLRDWRASLVSFLRFFIPYHKRSHPKEDHIESQIVPYDRTPLSSIEELKKLLKQVKMVLPQVEVPTLVVQARDDETILPKSANYIYEQIASKQKTISWYEKSTHMITLDKERDRLYEEIRAFIHRHSTDSGKEYG